MEKSTKFNLLKKYIFGPILCLPPVALELFATSIMASFLLTVILSLLSGSGLDTMIESVRGPTLDRLTYLWVFDPIFLLFIISFISAILIFFKAKVVKGADLWSRSMASFFPFLVVLAVFFIGETLIKPAFLVERPLDPLPEPQITQILEPFFSSTSEADSMPSGFVMRQVSAFLFATWIILGVKISNISKIILEITNVVSLAFVSFSRVYRGAHLPIDIAVAIGIGTLIFWLLVLTPYTLVSLRGRRIERVYLSTLTGGFLILFMVTLGFSNNPGGLVKLFSISIIILGIIYVISPLINIPKIRILPRDFVQKQHSNTE